MSSIEIYKLLDKIDDTFYCYIHIIDNDNYQDRENAYAKNIYNCLVANRRIKDIHEEVIIFNYNLPNQSIEVEIAQHQSNEYKVLSLNDEIIIYDKLLDHLLMINKYIETLTYFKNNEESEEGNVMLFEIEIGDLILERILKENMKINKIQVIKIEKDILTDKRDTQIEKDILTDKQDTQS